MRRNSTGKLYAAAIVSLVMLVICIVGIECTATPPTTYSGAVKASREQAQHTSKKITFQPVQTEEQIVSLYTDEDLELLAKVINAEMGANWVPDEVQRKVGSVVLNRVASEAFPSTMYDVVHQRGQYACAWNGSFNKEITEKVWDNARYLLEHGSVLPADVLYQSTNANNGSGVYDKYYDPVMKNTTYFCYG